MNRPDPMTTPNGCRLRLRRPIRGANGERWSSGELVSVHGDGETVLAVLECEDRPANYGRLFRRVKASNVALVGRKRIRPNASTGGPSAVEGKVGV
jgi:hypothetical protein